MTKIERILTDREYQDLLSACKESNLEQLSDIVEFAYLTAMRFGEITKLQVKDINFEKSLATLHDTKNGETREVPLVQRALDIWQIPFRTKYYSFKQAKYYFQYIEISSDIILSKHVEKQR